MADHRELRPRQPEQEKDQRGLADALPVGVDDQQMDELREREDEREVEEQLDGVRGEILGRFRNGQALHRPDTSQRDFEPAEVVPVVRPRAPRHSGVPRR